jgi:adenine-specific DNA-methyltransferase
VSRLTDLITHTKAKDAQTGADLEREFKALSSRLAFGLNFERHRPEAVELPERAARKGDKVRVLPERGSTRKGDQRLWAVKQISRNSNGRFALLELLGQGQAPTMSVPVDDIVVVAEFRDLIYPGLVSTGKVVRGGDKPFHTIINGENYHALRALTFTHRGKIDAIYIDPPYNSGARDWKYNNDYVEAEDLYRHSKWLAFMERRLKIAQELLKPDNSVLIVTIDEKEYLRLGLLMEQMFPEARIQMVSTLINPANVARAGGFGRSDEYIFVAMFGNAVPGRLRLGREWVSSKGRTHTGNVRWDLLRRSGTNAERSHSPGCFYPIYIEPKSRRITRIGPPLPKGQSQAKQIQGLVAVLPIRKDKSEGNWQWSGETLEERVKQGRVRIGGNVKRGFVVYILKDGEYGKIERGEFQQSDPATDGSLVVEDNDATFVLAIPGTQWRIAGHDATQYGSRLLADLLPGRRFPFPKSLYAVEDTLRFFVHDKPKAIILDFFSGSGTTAHAVMRLNRQDSGRRQCISVTNNEVAADEQASLRKRGLRPGDAEWERWGICEYITKPRVEAAITGKTPSGEPVKGNYKFTDESPIASGLPENAEFFTLTYETPVAVSHSLAFARIAPLLWMRAGSEGRRIDALPRSGSEVVDTYGLLTDLDHAAKFCTAVEKNDGLRIAYIVTDDDRRFQAVARRLPASVEAVQLYESYLTNFRFSNGE